MKKSISLLVSTFCLIPLITVACSVTPAEVTLQAQQPSEVIPLETALQTLDEFLNETEPDMLPTKSGSARRILSVDTYYAPAGTKSSSLETAANLLDEEPLAYIVNFDDDEGFAVLGATTKVAPIIAVTEKGNLDPLSLELLDSPIHDAEINPDDDDDTVEDEDDDVVMPMMNADSVYYSIEDDEYYSDINLDVSKELTADLLKNAMCSERISYDDSSHPQSETVVTYGNSSDFGSGVALYAEKSPLLKTNWGQYPPYNYYCKRISRKSAWVGCSVVALGLILTCNEFPDTLVINGNAVDWTNMKSYPYIKMLSDYDQEYVKQLLASIFYNVNRVAMADYTMVTPRQIEKRMVNLGYANVVRHKSRKFDSNLLQKVSDMLEANKPVFISCVPAKLSKAHSWVIDGAKYKNGNYLIHMNFGWEGVSNGYYTIDSLNPEYAAEYDGNHTGNDELDYSYTSNFRLITYNLPTTPISISVDF